MKLRGEYNNFLDLISDCFTHENVKDSDLFCIVVWRIWFCRNSTFHEAKKHNMSEVVSWSKDFLQEYRKSNIEIRREVVSNNIRRGRWIPPEKDDYKANCDAVLDQGKGTVGIGMVIRNCEGLVLAAGSMCLEGTFNIKTAKLLAILRCIQFSFDCGLRLKKIESDEATVVKWIKEGLNLDSDYGTLLSEINCLIDKEKEAKVCAISKDANKVAKGLAEKAYWMEEFPECVREEVETDTSG
ncbi:hypothetical protein LWI29_015099 [Acer saccharum]|uniref:RNase H type-1 domain-containing protein n=1 Tax=Acer saccharum TaxID=4024 RepID=A0AA39W1Q0_ACESA|nr:hypothetical protein LWI29_015099 [Acer saccharum]